MTPEDGGIYLALRAASRMWELPSWQSYYSLAPSDWPRLREVVREALADGPLTLEGLGAAITARPQFRHLAFAFDGNPWSLLKAFAWQGDLSFGPEAGRTTFQRLDDNPRWAGVPELDEAGMRAVEAYFGAYGPATPDNVQYWLGEGLGAGRKRIRAWIAGFGDRLVAVEIEGESAFVLREHLEDLAATPPTTANTTTTSVGSDTTVAAGTTAVGTTTTRTITVPIVSNVPFRGGDSQDRSDQPDVPSRDAVSSFFTAHSFGRWLFTPSRRLKLRRHKLIKRQPRRRFAASCRLRRTKPQEYTPVEPACPLIRDRHVDAGARHLLFVHEVRRLWQLVETWSQQGSPRLHGFEVG
jgi:hypothetical protein